ncbi:ABC transporter substrate-binding protein [Fodinibius halophilus]|uniref:ABC transporter substrate-binding protein n=1 Tax=Fodinibius halophilus TaxID=1736908 RepID=A0A6M1TDS5_9BACT|nr:ABC transporter substrate-binding protein [Fodinibius halophilus]NGP86840.1 ABC transporter substrate-binding protein [Fodinibius halophilus]
MTEKAFGRKAVSMLQQRFYHLCFRLLIIVIFPVVLTVIACQKTSEKPKTSNVPADSTYFQDQVHTEFAEGFQIEYHNNYKLLEILKPFQDKVDTLRYALVPRELKGKVDVEGARAIPIPIRSMVASSTTHIGLLEMLEANEVLSGMVGAEYVYSSKVRKGIESGEIMSLKQGEINKEKVLELNPDLLMISGGQSSQFDNYRVLIESGINILVNSEWLETTPLGKAEWVKVMAALLNKEKVANKKFDAVVARYNKLKAATDTVSQKPMIINSMPYKGAWFVSAGDSFAAQFLKDAGADYPWLDTEGTGGLRKSFEVVYEQGLEADIWLNPGSAQTKEDILAKDSRFKEFKALKTGEIYNNNKRLHPSGGNDYWESGVVNPDILLADLIKILHPQIVPDHQLYYYQKIK